MSYFIISCNIYPVSSPCSPFSPISLDSPHLFSFLSVLLPLSLSLSPLCWCPLGPFFRYQTYVDWISQPDPVSLPGREPCLHRLKMVPVYGALFLFANSLFPLSYVRTEEFLENNFFFRCVCVSGIKFCLHYKYTTNALTVHITRPSIVAIPTYC